MKKGFFAMFLSLVFLLAACSQETSNEEKEETKVATTKDSKSNNESSEKVKNETKKYSFKDFVKMSDQEQQDFIIPFVNGMGYNNELALKLLTFINDEDSDIREHFKTVNDYVTYYIENSDLPSYKLATSTSESEDAELIAGELSKEVVKKRKEAIKGKPLFEITDSNQLTILGLSIGNSFQDVISMLGKEDGIGKTKEGGVVYEQYYYDIPEVKKDNEYYRLIVRYGDNGETPDAITKIRLIMNNKGEMKPTLDIPKEFTNNFQGEVNFHTPIDHPFINEGGSYTLNFLHNTGITQGLEIHYKSNDFDLTAEVWGQDQLYVFKNQTSSIYDEITMEQAKKVLQFEAID